MQTAPTNWTALWNNPHRVCYRINIDGVDYTKNDFSDVPIIERPLMQEPSIGRCCTANLTLTIRQKAGVTIPKAAPVSVFCWLENSAGEKSGELELGHFFISRRSGNGALLAMTCRDGMAKAGQTYQDKTAYTEWPVAMTDVVAEICSIMGVELDSRTVIQTGDDYKVSFPNEDTLITEILSGIAAAHGGNFVITETGKLRLVPSLKSTGVSFYRVDKQYYGYTPYSNGAKTISRITLNDSAGNQFTTGDDTGIEIAATCDYATQAIVDAMASAQVVNSVLELSEGELDGGALQVDEPTGLLGRSFIPYSLGSAYLDPRVEIGDRLVVGVGDGTKVLLANYLKIQCSAAFICDSSNGIQDDDEDEFPYVDAATQKAKQYIKAGTSYFGNSITRKEGFKSELMVNGEAKARAILNAGMLALQQMGSDGNWVDCIYFDATTGRYKIAGSVDVQAQESDASRVWYQTSAPQSPNERDLWIDLTDGANTPKRWNGEEWVEVSDKTAADAKAIAEAASSTVSGLATRVSTVENKITPTEILNSIKSTTQYTADMTYGRNFALGTAESIAFVDRLCNGANSRNFDISSQLYDLAKGSKPYLRLSFSIKRSNIKTDGVYFAVWLNYSYRDSGGQIKSSGTGYRFRTTDGNSNILPFAETDSDWVQVKVAMNLLSTADVTALSRISFSMSEVLASMTGTVEVENLKLEISGAYTNWTAAPEDIGPLATRVTEAEQKITADAIVSTVRSSAEYSNDLGSKVGTGDFNNLAGRVGNAESSITQLSTSISSKVSAGNIISTINQSAEQIKIDAIKIKIGAFTYGNADKDNGVPGALYCGGQLNTPSTTSTGISADNTEWAFWAGSGAFRVAQNGYVYAGNAYVSGTLSAGNWVFNSSGSRYTNGSAAVEMKFDGSKAWFASSNCAVQYGSDYNYTCTIRGKDVRIATGHDNSAVVIEHIGSADDPSLYCEGAGGDWSGARGNLGGTSHRWDVCYVRSFHQSSSRKVKHDIQDLGDTGEIVDALRPVSFVYNGADKTTYTGLIYEETLPVYPYICLESKDGKPEEAGIDYTKLIPLMLNEIKHLRRRVATLEN